MKKPQQVPKVDLTVIIDKIYEEQPYSYKRIQKIADEYLKFIFLAQKHRFPIIPSKEVDIFWHYHILNTPHYRAFCDQYFGKYVDHLPMLKKEASEVGNASFLKTQAAFKRAYHHYMTSLKPSFFEKLFHHIRIYFSTHFSKT